MFSAYNFENMAADSVKARLQNIANDRGGRLFGVCRIDELQENLHPEIRELSGNLNTAVSIGIPLSPSVLESITDRPNMIYRAHYQQVNHILNDIAFEISSEIERMQKSSIPIPASQILDWKRLRAHLSHREIAYKAGLGWWGRNNLLVNEKYGSAVRLVTVLTDLDLEPDRPLERDCEDCYACLDACPVNAIAEDREDFNLRACYDKVSEFSKYNNFGHLICGLCLQRCAGTE